MPITVIGSLNQDIVAYTSRVPNGGETVKGQTLEYHLGGKGFNEAIALARLKSPNDKVTIKLWGNIGEDLVANQFIDSLNKEGIDTSQVTKVKGSSGTAIIMVERSSGDNRILIVPGANGLLAPSNEELDHYFNKVEIATTLDHPHLPSNIHSHSTQPLHHEEIAKTNDILNHHQPSHIHSHGSQASLQRALENQHHNTSQNVEGLINKNGSLIHHPSINSYDNLKNMNESLDNHLNQSPSFIHSHSTVSQKEPIFKIQSSYSEAIPSGLSAHASHPKLETLTYPSPRPESFANSEPGSSLNLAAKSHLNLNLNSNSRDVSARNSYLNITAKLHLNDTTTMISDNIDNTDNKHFVVIQNEFSNSTKVIHHLSKNSPNVSIFYNPSPLINLDSDLLDALHESHYIIVNEHEANQIVQNYHPSPDRSPLTLLKNKSNFEPNEDINDFVNNYVAILTKIRTLLTKPNIIITMGGNGVLYSETGQFSYAYVPSNDLDDDEVVDTTGCGDTFLGGFTLSIYRGDNLDSAVKFANNAAGATAMKRGAADAIPYWKDIERRGWLL